MTGPKIREHGAYDKPRDEIDAMNAVRKDAVEKSCHGPNEK
jgi:hypothetical protein